MSLKHFEEYYNEVSAQYGELLENLKEMEELCQQGMISPERVDNLQKIVAPVKDNYMTISYIKYLLNKPNRKEKQKRYEGQNKKFLSSIDKSKTKEEIINQNRTILDNMKL